ncbi:MAG: DUF4404 family protein [Phormidesmis sp.]
MSKEAVNQAIEALHAEINQLDTPDVTIKEKLLLLIGDVEKQMQSPDSPAYKPEHKDVATQQLPALIEQFEADHPKVTNTLGRLLNTLSGMGI